MEIGQGEKTTRLLVVGTELNKELLYLCRNH